MWKMDKYPDKTLLIRLAPPPPTLTFHIRELRVTDRYEHIQKAKRNITKLHKI